ncbi:MAG TPA: SpoIID/LytB domain-containing protein [bacterium]|nr:SpoIID/LytB domain-containing protein [bacterium]HNE82462.1 SpoIID/LytB domain-containing protein [bacterium]
MKKMFLLIAGSMLLWAGCTSAPRMRSIPEGTVIPEVKVLIARSSQSVNISSKEAFAVKTDDNQDVGFISAGQNVELRFNENRVEIYDATGKSLGAYGNLIFTTKSSSQRYIINNKQYRGSLWVTTQEGKILVINRLDMESYLMGVVRNEIGNLGMDQIEASKAQAVAARTYAIKNKGKYKIFDFQSDINDQVYDGAGTETEVSNQAVIETLGEVAEYDSKPIDAVFYSTAGGVTTRSHWVWKSSDPKPYLNSISTKIGDKALDEASPHYRWEVKWTGEEIEKIIKTNLPTVLAVVYPNEDFSKLATQRLYNLAVVSRDSSQRVQEFKIGFSKDSYTVTGEQARRIMRGEKYMLYSSLFRLDVMRNADGTIQAVNCKGAGFGHGVGMCQYSAREMAKTGYSYKQILKFFYRGTDIRKMY